MGQFVKAIPITDPWDERSISLLNYHKKLIKTAHSCREICKPKWNMMVYGKDLRLPKTSFSVIHMNQGYTQTAGKPGAPNNQIYGKLASQAKFGDCGQNPGMTRNHQKLTVNKQAKWKIDPYSLKVTKNRLELEHLKYKFKTGKQNSCFFSREP